jgi:multiple sugar transport system permease protein
MSSLSSRPTGSAWQSFWQWLRTQEWLMGDQQYRPGRLRGLWRVVQVLAILFFLLVSILPFYWLVRASLLQTVDYTSMRFTWWTSAPQWINFARVIEITEGLFLQWWGNTLLLAVLLIVNTLIVNGLAAYVFAKLEFPGKNILYFIFLATMMVPHESTYVPIFLIVRLFGWYDTYLGQVLPGVISAFTIFLLRQFFEGLPRELEDAARIDGCHELGVFWHIIIPLSRPILVVVSVTTLMAAIESFIWPLIVTQSPEIRPIGVALATVRSLIPPGDNPALVMAATLMMVLPTLIFLLFAQKVMVKGLAGSLVG